MAAMIPDTPDRRGTTPPAPAGYRLREELLVPAGGAGVVRLARGEVLQLVDVEGQQVADLMAWRLADPGEALSPAHTVSCLARLVPREGDSLFSTCRRPLLRLRRDTVGRHDLVVPCCDPERYRLDFGLDDHPSCLASIQAALAEAGETWPARASWPSTCSCTTPSPETAAWSPRSPPTAPAPTWSWRPSTTSASSPAPAPRT
jgi:uncharacterized protein YcgI (DUF1989 family)